jgi:hypothetical protein
MGQARRPTTAAIRRRSSSVAPSPWRRPGRPARQTWTARVWPASAVPVPSRRATMDDATAVSRGSIAEPPVLDRAARAPARAMPTANRGVVWTRVASPRAALTAPRTREKVASIVEARARPAVTSGMVAAKRRTAPRDCSVRKRHGVARWFPVKTASRTMAKSSPIVAAAHVPGVRRGRPARLTRIARRVSAAMTVSALPRVARTE